GVTVDASMKSFAMLVRLVPSERFCVPSRNTAIFFICHLRSLPYAKRGIQALKRERFDKQDSSEILFSRPAPSTTFVISIYASTGWEITRRLLGQVQLSR